MSEIVNKMGDLVSAFGTAANDAQSFFDALAAQGSQPINFDASAAQASQLLSMANAVAASAALVLGKLPVPAGYIGSAGLAISIESLGVNSAQLTRAIGSGNYNDIITSVAAVAASVGGAAVSVDSILGAAGWATRMFPWAIPLTLVATAVQMVWQNRESFVWAGNELLDAFRDATQQATFTGDLARSVNDLFTAAQNYVIPRRDPLVLDLDGDGIELIGANGTVLFDHNADGIKTGTGWVRPDDGLLVRDLNGNGLIDSGRELFGIDTLKANNTLAANGFDALRELDSNRDGFITVLDTAYAELKVWRDLNQDGVSQATELQSLSTLGISSIGVNGTATGPQAGQVIAGNRVDLSTTFTQNGAARTVGAIDFQVNDFYTQFPAQVVDQVGNPVAITAQALALPQMNGSGMVRNMQAAASLNAEFAGALALFAGTTTRDAQRSQLDDLITKWAATSTFADSVLAFNANVTYTMPAGVTVAQYLQLIDVLEAFNGTHFYGRTGPMPAGFAVIASTAPVTGTVTYSYVVSPPAEQVALLQQAYDALKESVYSALVVQTRLKPFLKLEGNVSNMSCSFRRRAKLPLRNINLTSGENWRALVMRRS